MEISSFRLSAFKKKPAQGTVELLVVFPTLLLLALIASNALLFFSECAAFDTAFREAVRVCAGTPAQGVEPSSSAGAIEDVLLERFSYDFESVSVGCEEVSGGHVRYTGTLIFEPTFFGGALRSSVFGVTFTPLQHGVQLTVDCYKPALIA